MQPHGFGHPHALERDVRVLHHAQRGLAVDFLQCDARGLALHQEAFDLPVGDIAGEHGQHIGGPGAADPALSPSSTHSAPSRRAVVDRPPAMSEPDAGSVSAKTPLSEKSTTLGSHSLACSSEAPSRTAVRKSPDWAL